MNKTRSIIGGISVGAVIGITLTFLIAFLGENRKRQVKNEQDWFVCKMVNMHIIAEAIREYEQMPGSSNLVTLQTLADAKLLPDWSEIYICPGQFKIPILRSNYDDSFVSNIFSPSRLAANYENCSYYIEVLPNAFRVRCLYHTNLVDVIIPKSPPARQP